jgi:hypothetical protein
MASLRVVSVDEFRLSPGVKESVREHGLLLWKSHLHLGLINGRRWSAPKHMAIHSPARESARERSMLAFSRQSAKLFDRAFTDIKNEFDVRGKPIILIP